MCLLKYYRVLVVTAVLQVADTALFNLRQLHSHRAQYSIVESLCPALSWRIELEEAKTEWDRGEATLAMGLLKSLLTKFGKVEQFSIELSLTIIHSPPINLLRLGPSTL